MQSAPSHLLARARRPVVAALVALSLLAPARAAPPAVSTAFVPVTIDGSATAYTSFTGQSFNVVFDGAVFHLWYRAAGNAPDFNITHLRHAVSTNGVNFTTVGGAFSFAVDPFTSGTPPWLYYDAVSVVGGDYKIVHWTSNGDAGSFPGYNYNSSVSSIGASPANTVLTHQGAISGGTFGQTAGTFGLESGRWIGQCGGTGQEVCSVAYTDGNPPSVPASIYPATIDASGLFTALSIPTGYINNHGDVRPGGVGLDLAFTVRDGTGTRFNQQVYFSESSDGGATWTAPVGLLGGAPTLAGGFGGNPNFAHPELLRVGSGALLYVSTANASGEFIIAVADSRVQLAANSVPVPTLGGGALAALLGLLALFAIPALRRRGIASR